MMISDIRKSSVKFKTTTRLIKLYKNAELSYKQEDWNNSIKNYKLALNLSSNDISIKNQIDKLNQIIDIKSKLDKFINEPDIILEEIYKTLLIEQMI